MSMWRPQGDAPPGPAAGPLLASWEFSYEFSRRVSLPDRPPVNGPGRFSLGSGPGVGIEAAQLPHVASVVLAVLDMTCHAETGRHLPVHLLMPPGFGGLPVTAELVPGAWCN